MHACEICMPVFEYRVYPTLQVPVHRLYTPLDTLATLYDDIFALSPGALSHSSYFISIRPSTLSNSIPLSYPPPLCPKVRWSKLMDFKASGRYPNPSPFPETLSTPRHSIPPPVTLPCHGPYGWGKTISKCCHVAHSRLNSCFVHLYSL